MRVALAEIQKITGKKEANHAAQLLERKLNGGKLWRELKVSCLSDTQLRKMFIVRIEPHEEAARRQGFEFWSCNKPGH